MRGRERRATLELRPEFPRSLVPNNRGSETRLPQPSFWTKLFISLGCWLLIGTLLVSVIAAVVARHEKQPYHDALWNCSVGGHTPDLVAGYLAILGIVFAYFHDRELEKQTREFDLLERSLSTRRLGPFPLYLSKVERLIDAAKQDAADARDSQIAAQQDDYLVHIDVLSDCLDYGSFFAPADHKRVHQALAEAAADPSVRVRLLVCTEDIPEPFTGPSGQRLTEYPDADKLLREYQNTLESDRGFVDWIDRLTRNPSGWPRIAASWFVGLVGAGAEMPDWKLLLSGDLPKLSNDEDRQLKLLLQIRQLWFASELQRKGVKIRWLPRGRSLFLWTRYRYAGTTLKEIKKRDIDDDALFTFAHAMGGEGQLGFSTHDYDLLSSFRSFFEQTWERADPGTDKYCKPRRQASFYWPDVLGEIDVGSVGAITSTEIKRPTACN